MQSPFNPPPVRGMNQDDASNADGGDCIPCGNVRFIPRSYDRSDSRGSALQLILTALPEWCGQQDSIGIIQCTDGITNTLLKVINRQPCASQEAVEKDAVLLRAYGSGTDVIIDRARETMNHEVLMKHGLAPPLLARFHNGMIYRYIPGTVTRPSDLRTHSISMAIARHLAQWHAVVPCQYQSELPASTKPHGRGQSENENGNEHNAVGKETSPVSIHPHPNLWTVMQKWISALPVATLDQRMRQASLETELFKVMKEFGGRAGLGKHGLVFAHCDLLSGNIIVRPSTYTADGAERQLAVTFIDYEYATPSPAAFDIANHFAEWAGIECDYNAMPTQTQRRAFIQEYVRTYFSLLNKQGEEHPTKPDYLAAQSTKLLEEVDSYRGIPGLYWGIWSVIQAVISDIDFDYALYAELRLDEYWAWRAQCEGSLAAQSQGMQLRERRWAQED